MTTIRSMVVIATLFGGLLLQQAGARADNGGAYPAGWNMVSGPPGTDFSAAAEMYAYTSGAYAPPATSRVQLCTGYWAYFNQSATVPLTGQPPANASQACPLNAGWNMVGNPFDTVATLPAGTIAYHWNAGAARYDLVTEIPSGAAVWIYSSTTGTILLQEPNVPPPNATVTPPNTLTITAPLQPAYQVHQGWTVALMLATPPDYEADADPRYFTLVDAGVTTSDPPTKFWHWRALAVGTAYINVEPACRQVIPPCAAPGFAIRVDIVP